MFATADYEHYRLYRSVRQAAADYLSDHSQLLWNLRRPSYLDMPLKPGKTHFRTIGEFNTDYSPSVISQYVSERTGMTVVTVNQKGPKVLGFFALATEIHDDSGAPHTLEHLCFMGSKGYRYKGVLDKLATRAYSTTNAWTATDHTAYTLDTAGWAGFAQILPVYLEHVIVPTLTDAGCYTEVHHVDGSGHDAGVVYSEMQGVQNTQGELMELVSKRLLYPEGVGFRYETGGMMEQLRVLTADRIREFHREMYQPKNLCLVIVGEIDHNDLLRILDDFEATILQDIPKPDAPFKRPWVQSKPAPPIQKTSVVTVDFPEEDESSGEILISFFGPDCNNTLEGEWCHIQSSGHSNLHCSYCVEYTSNVSRWVIRISPRKCTDRERAVDKWRLFHDRASAPHGYSVVPEWRCYRKIS